MTPAMGAVLEQFSLSQMAVQWLVTVYLIGYGLSELPYGWLAQRYGRRRVLGLSLIVFALGAFVCAMAGEYWHMLVGRGVMAFGAGMGLMIGYAIVGLNCELQEGRRVLGWTSSLVALAPGISSFLGGILVGMLHWSCCFYALIMYAGLVWLRVRRMPESESVPFRHTTSAYLTLMRQRGVFFLCVMSALTSVLMYVFVTVAPLTTMRVLNLSPQVYGYMSAAPVSGGFGGCLLAAYLASRLSAVQTIRIGFVMAFVGVAFKMTALSAFGLQAWTLFAPMFVIYFSLPLIYTNGIMMALDLSDNKPVASAFFCTINIALSVVGVLVVSLMKGVIYNFSPVCLVLVLGMWVCFQAAQRSVLTINS